MWAIVNTVTKDVVAEFETVGEAEQACGELEALGDPTIGQLRILEERPVDLGRPVRTIPGAEVRAGSVWA